MEMKVIFSIMNQTPVPVYVCSLLWLGSRFAVVPAQEQGDGVASGGGDESAAGQQGKRISWAVCVRFSLLSERLSVSLCSLDDADEQDVAGPMGRGGVGGNAAAGQGKVVFLLSVILNQRVFVF